MNILLTGASGFIGKHLATHLSKTTAPGNQIHTVGRHSLDLPGVKHHVLDLLEEEKVLALIQQIRPSQIFHLVGISQIRPDYGMEEYFRTNFLTTVHLLQAIAAERLKVQFFFASSMHVYGNQEGIIDETSGTQPLSHYAFTKLLAEEALRAAVNKNSELSVVVGRLYSCFGPGQPEGFVAADLCKKISQLPASQEAVLQVGPLNSYRRFIDVRDMVQAIGLLMQKAFPHRYEIYNIASPHELEIRQMVDILLKLAGKSPKIQSTESSFNQFRGLKIKLDKLQSVVPAGIFRPVEATLKDMLSGGNYGG